VCRLSTASNTVSRKEEIVRHNSLPVLLAARVYNRVWFAEKMQQRYCQAQPHPMSHPVINSVL